MIIVKLIVNSASQDISSLSLSCSQYHTHYPELHGSVHIVFIWAMTSCAPVGGYESFGGNSDITQWGRTQIGLMWLRIGPFARSFKHDDWLTIYQTTCCLKPENHYLNIYLWDNLKSHIEESTSHSQNLFLNIHFNIILTSIHTSLKWLSSIHIFWLKLFINFSSFPWVLHSLFISQYK
jgi:hypothetical protein